MGIRKTGGRWLHGFHRHEVDRICTRCSRSLCRTAPHAHCPFDNCRVGTEALPPAGRIAGAIRPLSWADHASNTPCRSRAQFPRCALPVGWQKCAWHRLQWADTTRMCPSRQCASSGRLTTMGSVEYSPQELRGIGTRRPGVFSQNRPRESHPRWLCLEAGKQHN